MQKGHALRVEIEAKSPSSKTVYATLRFFFFTLSEKQWEFMPLNRSKTCDLWFEKGMPASLGGLFKMDCSTSAYGF